MQLRTAVASGGAEGVTRHALAVDANVHRLTFRLLRSNQRHVRHLRAPFATGPYRLFAYLDDGTGRAAVWNVPFLVR